MILLAMPAVLSCIILLFSCEKYPAEDISHAAASAVITEAAGGELVKIAGDARETVHIFIRHAARPESGEDNFFVKYPLETDGVITEQIWLGDITFRDGKYYGVASVEPAGEGYPTKGDTVRFEPGKITDWIYTAGGKITGGRSIKYLLEKIPENSRTPYQRLILRMFE